ncbi:hydrolase [Serpentinicella sp. ANB-PHB4]|uniref:hydrolase n=1 Tax=Serpentinicella sp. ANB-PHB4 TaxID=3074076 RepID=UPI002857D2BB|nr:hydrolase [Serpentinicella sp. ANB-PHB4]MDR5657935.1 hydrolase [Serpentinicella sp. ANB-PHB4]
MESKIKKTKYVPEIKGVFRSNYIELPKCIAEASGIKVFGRRIKSVLFSTDVAIIKNTNADSVIAVYPFTPQLVINQALLLASDVPVFCGVGGGHTTGNRVINIALHAEFQGAIGVVVNKPTPNEIITALKDTIDIPIVVTVVSENEDVLSRLRAGAGIINVSGAKNTPNIVKKIRQIDSTVPIIATGGNTEETVQKTIEAGANAITFTPPTTADIFAISMNKYREL